MIIDSHRHLVGSGWTRGGYVLSLAKMFGNLWNRVHRANKTTDEFIQDVMQTFVDPEGDRIVEEMDRAGVDKTVIFAVDWGLATGEPSVGIREQNRAHAYAAMKHPGRFIPLAGIDPRRGDAMRMARECIEEWGMKGFKLMPSAGFHPDDPICWPLYEYCSDRKLPIMFHAGGIEVGWQWAQPMYISTAAEKFHDVKMIMAHAGCESWQQAMWACRHIPNMYMDISIWQWEFAMFPEKFYRWLRDIVDEVTPWKVLFATDAPYPNTLVPLVDWVGAIKNPKTSTVTFTREEKDILLGRAAEQVWDLSPMKGVVPEDPLKNEYGR